MKDKHKKLWAKCRAAWVKLNPPNHQGYYICWIGGEWVHWSEMELDHIISRSRRPDLRYVFSNLAPSCHDHNTEKGSKEHHEVEYEDVELPDVW